MEPYKYGSESDRLRGFCLLGTETNVLAGETKQAFVGLGSWLSR